MYITTDNASLLKVMLIYKYIVITSTALFDLPELTTETLKKPYLRALFVNYTWAPEGAAIICFTSGKVLFLVISLTFFMFD